MGEQQELIAELAEALRWSASQLEQWDAYQKRPGHGDYGVECACCMGEMFDLSDYDQFAWNQKILAKASAYLDPKG